MKFVIAFTIGLSASFLMSSCSSAPKSGLRKFPYKYYALEASSYVGKLKGPEIKDDLPLDRCAPVAGNVAPCVCMFGDELLRLKADVKER